MFPPFHNILGHLYKGIGEQEKWKEVRARGLRPHIYIQQGSEFLQPALRRIVLVIRSSIVDSSACLGYAFSQSADFT